MSSLMMPGMGQGDTSQSNAKHLAIMRPFRISYVDSHWILAYKEIWSSLSRFPPFNWAYRKLDDPAKALGWWELSWPATYGDLLSIPPCSNHGDRQTIREPRWCSTSWTWWSGNMRHVPCHGLWIFTLHSQCYKFPSPQQHIPWSRYYIRGVF